MWSLFERTKDLALTFCEHCGRLCDDACRRTALHERLLLQELRFGVPI